MLAAWQQEYDDNMPGWSDKTSIRAWNAKGEVLATELRVLLGKNATLELRLP
jgi:hypothetical protein